VKSIEYFEPITSEFVENSNPIEGFTMPLELNEKSVLPDGIHDASLAEVGERFGQFRRSDRRSRLFQKLEEYIQELRKAEINGWLIVDGSFVMGCVDEPDDIDIVLILTKTLDMATRLKPFQYNLLSKRDIKRNFPFDVFTVREESPEERDWTNFFSKINVKWYERFDFQENSTKGLVRILI